MLNIKILIEIGHLNQIKYIFLEVRNLSYYHLSSSSKYSQLNLESRYQIKALLDAGHTQSESARTIGVHRSTVCRELKRNVTNSAPEDKDSCPKAAQQLTDRITQRLGRIPSAFIKTLTFDDDKAFARHQKIADQVESDTYFTRPYTSQDKGTVENRIWDFDSSSRRVQTCVRSPKSASKPSSNTWNFRPVRKFDYLSPSRQTLKHRCVALIT